MKEKKVERCPLCKRTKYVGTSSRGKGWKICGECLIVWKGDIILKVRSCGGYEEVKIEQLRATGLYYPENKKPKKKLMIVEHCHPRECVHCDSPYCSHPKFGTSGKLFDSENIPEWCPLDDYKDKKEN
jgi:hypothetical protein